MRSLLLTLLTLLLCGFIQSSRAVQVSSDGLGEVLIYPYYTVNNGLNTLYSVVNTTDQAKAIRLRFQEGGFGHDVLTFNVYLSPYDVWTGALAATVSTIPGHINELSVLHLTSDTSCAPFLIKNGQEFLPFKIDTDGENNNLLRAREGHLEIIEMGVVTGETAAAIDHQNTGVPTDCGLIENEWADDGEWGLGDLDDPSGGLMGSGTLVNVAEGLALPFDAIALQNFWQQSGFHTDPGNEEPTLASAFPESKVLLDSGELAESEWSTGYEAVSAVLMNAKIYNEYALDSIVNGKSEWVVTFPTKKYHTIDSSAVRSPFTSLWNGQASCDVYEIEIYDREEQYDQIFPCNVTCPPQPSGPKICNSSNVLEFLLPGMPTNFSSSVLGSNNLLSWKTPSVSFATESGWVWLEFIQEQQRMTPLNGVGYLGLPVIGFSVQQFTNAGAADGLLAQYGGLYKHKGEIMTFIGGGDE